MYTPYLVTILTKMHHAAITLNNLTKLNYFLLYYTTTTKLTIHSYAFQLSCTSNRLNLLRVELCKMTTVESTLESTLKWFTVAYLNHTWPYTFQYSLQLTVIFNLSLYTT